MKYEVVLEKCTDQEINRWIQHLYHGPDAVSHHDITPQEMWEGLFEETDGYFYIYSAIDLWGLNKEDANLYRDWNKLVEDIKNQSDKVVCLNDDGTPGCRLAMIDAAFTVPSKSDVTVVEQVNSLLNLIYRSFVTLDDKIAKLALTIQPIPRKPVHRFGIVEISATICFLIYLYLMGNDLYSPVMVFVTFLFCIAVHQFRVHFDKHSATLAQADQLENYRTAIYQEFQQALFSTGSSQPERVGEN